MKTLRPSGPDFSNFEKYSKEITNFRNNISQLEVLASTIKYEISFGRLDAGGCWRIQVLTQELKSIYRQVTNIFTNYFMRG